MEAKWQGGDKHSLWHLWSLITSQWCPRSENVQVRMRSVARRASDRCASILELMLGKSRCVTSTRMKREFLRISCSEHRRQNAGTLWSAFSAPAAKEEKNKDGQRAFEAQARHTEFGSRTLLRWSSCSGAPLRAPGSLQCRFLCVPISWCRRRSGAEWERSCTFWPVKAAYRVLLIQSLNL